MWSWGAAGHVRVATMEISTSVPAGHGHPWMLVPVVHGEGGFMQGAVSHLFWAVGSGVRVLMVPPSQAPKSRERYRNHSSCQRGVRKDLPE